MRTRQIEEHGKSRKGNPRRPRYADCRRGAAREEDQGGFCAPEDQGGLLRLLRIRPTPSQLLAAPTTRCGSAGPSVLGSVRRAPRGAPFGASHGTRARLRFETWITNQKAAGNQLPRESNSAPVSPRSKAKAKSEAKAKAKVNAKCDTRVKGEPDACKYGGT